MQLFPGPGNELPDGMVAGGVTAADGTRLRYAVCPGPHIGRGTVCIFQGRGDFIERYFETIKDLRSRGYDVAILDWRGQGGSDRRLSDPYRVHIRSFREYDLDLAAFMTEVVLPDCRPPFVALAHSTGAVVVLRALKVHNWFERAVLSAPLIDIAPVGLPRPLVRFVARLITLVGLGRLYLPGRPRRPMRADDFPGNPVSSDRTRYLRDCRTLEQSRRSWASAGPPSDGSMPRLARWASLPAIPARQRCAPRCSSSRPATTGWRARRRAASSPGACRVWRRSPLRGRATSPCWSGTNCASNSGRLSIHSSGRLRRVKPRSEGR
jgi:alpha-beta hydrolase superfamily lysophospholipase